MSFNKINYFILWRAICMTGLTLRQLLTQIKDDELYNKISFYCKSFERLAGNLTNTLSLDINTISLFTDKHVSNLAPEDFVEILNITEKRIQFKYLVFYEALFCYESLINDFTVFLDSLIKEQIDKNLLNSLLEIKSYYFIFKNSYMTYDYNINIHYYLLSKDNKLVELNSSLEEANKVKWEKLVKCNRLLSSQLYKSNNLLPLIKEYLKNKIEFLGFWTKLENLIFKVNEKFETINVYPKLLYELNITPGIDEDLDLIVYEISKSCEFGEWELEKSLDQKESEIIKERLKKEISQFYQLIKKYE